MHREFAMVKMSRRGESFESPRTASLHRLSFSVLLAACLTLAIAGCTNALVDSISVSPTAQSLSAGQTAQFTATGVMTHSNNHPATSEDVTDSATWTSSSPSVATVNSTGLCTAISAGTTTISATMAG